MMQIFFPKNYKKNRKLNPKKAVGRKQQMKYEQIF